MDGVVFKVEEVGHGKVSMTQGRPAEKAARDRQRKDTSFHGYLTIPAPALANDSVDLGRAVVSTAIFGVSPKKASELDHSRMGEGAVFVRLAGETPTRATGTVALPNPTASMRLTRDNAVEQRDRQKLRQDEQDEMRLTERSPNRDSSFLRDVCFFILSILFILSNFRCSNRIGLTVVECSIVTTSVFQPRRIPALMG
jgi:hypothetical protein